MGLRHQLPSILHWSAGIPKQESTTSGSFKINRTQNWITAIDKGFTSTEEAVHFFCNVVDNLIACSLSKLNLLTPVMMQKPITQMDLGFLYVG
jgi:hypothetical protein